jgi:dTDP-4-dehydrorhamnose 3,5-epimerase
MENICYPFLGTTRHCSDLERDILQLVNTAIPGLMIVESPVFRDARGTFQELYRLDNVPAELDLGWKQDNLSISERNVVRGLHYQILRPQAKLIRVVHGAVFDVAVDLRSSSPTFGKHLSFELRAADGKALYIPPGFAHGFAVLEPQTAFLYKVSEYRCVEAERTLLWNDPDLDIHWPTTKFEAILSEKDRHGTRFRDSDVFS